jgi:aminomethyltransferase
MNRPERTTATRPRAVSPKGLIATPFEARLRALSTAHDWMDWGGRLSPASLDAVEPEYFAIRNQASLFDVSPMRKYRVTGPEAEAVVNRLVTRDVTTLAPGRVAYVVWCDEDGHVIDDGTLFRLGAHDFRLCCQERMAGWLHDIAWGFDASVVDETDDLAALALQGPTAHAVLAAAGLPLPALRPFGIAEPEAGLTISRTGFTGDLGYELWVAPEGALALWDRLWSAGRDLGLRAIGYRAVEIARIEAGFIMAGAEFQPIHRALRPTRGRTPYELGLGRMVELAKPHFNGRRALARLAREAPRRRLVMLDIEGTKPAEGALIYHRGRTEAGHATSAVWAPTAKRNIAFAEIGARFLRSPDLRAEIYTLKEGKWERTMAKASVIPRDVFRPSRARATPPGRF